MSRPRVRPSLAPFAPLAVLLLGSLASCSLTVDLAGYASGDDASLDASDGDIDSAADDTGPDSALDSGVDTSMPPPPDALAEGGADADATVDGAEASVDAAADAADASDAKTDAADATPADAADAADASDAADAGPCATVRNVGLSEVMVRSISGVGDTHEWFEIANYDASCTYDVGGLKVRMLSWNSSSLTFIEKATFTVPAGVSLAPGGTLVFADTRASFLVDAGAYYTTNGLDQSLVFDFGKTLGDLWVNSADNEVEIYPPGATTPSETTVVKSRSTWPIGRSFEFASVCDPALRLLTGPPVTTSTHWTDAPATVANQYGSAPTMPATALYGSPGRKNDLPTTCP